MNERAWLPLCLLLGWGVPAWCAQGRVSGAFKTDNFGYRPGDPKWAVAVVDPGTGLQLRREADDAVVWTLPSQAVTDLGQETDQPLIHGDHVWRIDFSGLQTPGRYHLYSPTLRQRSYDFSVGPTAYDAAALAVAKSFYYQRCGTPKPAAFGGDWHDDEACHLADAQASPLCGQGQDYGAMDYGSLDLSGGWHDAGDFEKKIGISKDCAQDAYADRGQTLWYLLNAYEAAPAFYGRRRLGIPESRADAPDLLSQIKWELDWYLRMQRPDGHVLAKVVVRNLGAFKSPPSADDNPRWYGPPTHEAEAIFVACVAHAARVYATVPFYAGYAQRLRTAASVTWGLWVLNAPESEHRFWAAAELYRLGLDPVQALAVMKAYRGWDGHDALTLTAVQNFGVITALQSAGLDPGLRAGMQASYGRLVDQVFASDDSYGSGMPAGLYSWNSNWYKADCGQTLLWGARLGAPGGHNAAACRAHAQGFLHYLHGLNPLGMTYLTHASMLGAPHGAWRVFNVWWGNSSDAESKRLYVGKPDSVHDPLYPYEPEADNFNVSDDGDSLYGPPPGFVPPGPTVQYLRLGGQSVPPLAAPGQGRPYAKAYRDWNWVDPSGTQSQPWIVNEAGIYDQAAYLALASALVSDTGQHGP